MTAAPKSHILTESWSKCETVIHALGMRSSDNLQKTLGEDSLNNISYFLTDLEFLSDRKLSQQGSQYFQLKYVLSDPETALAVLKNSLVKYKPTQAICQLLWGRPQLKRINIFNLLISEEYADPDNLSEQDLGSYLMLLNQCSIIKYSKKTNDITVILNPNTSSKEPTRFLSPETPYSNLRNLWELLRTCKSYIHWCDKHFTAKGLEPLYDEADGTSISEIKILAGITSTGMNEKLQRDFKRFKEELQYRKIQSELRVICEKSLLNNIHDRWIISDSICYNVPPVEAIFRGQYSELKQTTNRPLFADWWKIGFDILSQWQEIQNHIPDATATPNPKTNSPDTKP